MEKISESPKIKKKKLTSRLHSPAFSRFAADFSYFSVHVLEFSKDSESDFSFPKLVIMPAPIQEQAVFPCLRNSGGGCCW